MLDFIKARTPDLVSNSSLDELPRPPCYTADDLQNIICSIPNITSLRVGPAKVKPPIPALPAFNVAAEIFSFIDYKDMVKVKLRMISKKTKVYGEEHKAILESFFVPHVAHYCLQDGLKM